MRIEDKFGAKLPAAYLEFLRVMGRGAGKFLQGDDIFYNSQVPILELFDCALELLEEFDDSHLDLSNSYVFAFHQGYQFLFFRFGNPNPSVFLYSEGGVEFIKIYETFTEYIQENVDLTIAAFSKWNFKNARRMGFQKGPRVLRDLQSTRLNEF